MEEQCAEAGEKQSGLDVQGQAVGVDQDGDQHGGTEHGEHVLQPQQEHLGRAQLPRVADGFLAVHILSPFLSFGPGKKETTTINGDRPAPAGKKGKRMPGEQRNHWTAARAWRSPPSTFRLIISPGGKNCKRKNFHHCSIGPWRAKGGCPMQQAASPHWGGTALVEGTR